MGSVSDRLASNENQESKQIIFIDHASKMRAQYTNVNRSETIFDPRALILCAWLATIRALGNCKRKPSLIVFQLGQWKMILIGEFVTRVKFIESTQWHSLEKRGLKFQLLSVLGRQCSGSKIAVGVFIFRNWLKNDFTVVVLQRTAR